MINRRPREEVEKPRMLVVDDEDDVRTILNRFFTKKGYEVRATESAREAMSILESESMDVVLLDIQLPGITGIDALKQIRKRWPDVSVVMISGQSDEALARSTLQAGAFDYVVKPLNFDYLERTVSLGLVDHLRSNTTVIPRVLVVDDAPAVRSIIKRSLAKTDYEIVGEAEDGLEALALFNRLKPDLVILDLTMPKLHGLEVLRKIRETESEAKVLVVSSLDQDSLEQELLESGASGFLWKPFDPGSLIRAVEKVFSQEPIPHRRELSQEDLSTLKEIGNLGAGQAASALSALIQRTCLVDVPITIRGDAADLEGQFDFKKSVVASIGVQILGEVPAVMLVVVSKDALQRILGYLSGPDGDRQEPSLSAQAALNKLGSAMTTAFSHSIHEFLHTKGQPAKPEILIKDWTKTLDQAIKWIGQSNEKNVAAYSKFFDREKTFEGWCIYVLKDDAVYTVLERAQELLEP